MQENVELQRSMERLRIESATLASLVDSLKADIRAWDVERADFHARMSASRAQAERVTNQVVLCERRIEELDKSRALAVDQSRHLAGKAREMA